MPTTPSDGATSTTSATVLRAPRLRSPRNLTQMIGNSSSRSPNNIVTPQTQVRIPSHGPEDINAPSTQTEGDSTNVTTSSGPVAVATPLVVPYGRAIKIPYLRQTTYVFPDASPSISQAHKDRYPALKDILQRNIERSSKLCDYTSCISYELRMCGSCVADAIPSILVFCPFRKLKRIKSLFTQPHLKSQLEPESPTPTFVRFGLFFGARTIDMLAFHEIAVVIPEEQDSGEFVADAVVGNMPWGLRLLEGEHGEHGEQHNATVGCVIQIGSKLFGLTTAHALHHTPVTAISDHAVGLSDSDTDDEEYDIGKEEEDTGQISLERRPPSPTTSLKRTVKLGRCQVHTPPPVENTSAWMKGHANLDWALIELELNEDRPPPHATAIDALPIVGSLPQDSTNVLIITLSLPIPAILYNISSYIGGSKGSQAAEVWTVGSLPKESPIRKGDFGSTVVDARSGELFGMVVAVNPFGDVHIAPFAAILAQVKELFKENYTCVLNTLTHTTSPTSRPSIEANNQFKKYIQERPKDGNILVTQPDQTTTVDARRQEIKVEIMDYLASFDHEIRR